MLELLMIKVSFGCGVATQKVSVAEILKKFKLLALPIWFNSRISDLLKKLVSLSNKFLIIKFYKLLSEEVILYS